MEEPSVEKIVGERGLRIVTITIDGEILEVVALQNLDEPKED